MDAISYSHSAKQAQRIEKFIENPDSTSGVLTQPSVIQTGETVTVPAGRTAILANTQVDGTLTVDGTVFIPSGATLDGVVEKVVSTDNAVVRFNGVAGEVQNSGVIISDTNYLTITNGGVRLGNSTGIELLGVNVKSDSNDLIASVGRFNLAGTDISTLKFYADPMANTVTLDATGSSAADLIIKNGTVENCRFTTNGNLLLTSGTGALGYGTGSGGTVTQLTSKSTAVTLNKPTGQITMHNAALAAGASVVFTLNNSIISGVDVVITDWNNGNYRVTPYGSATGSCAFIVQNVSAGSLSDPLAIQFSVIKGATA